MSNNINIEVAARQSVRLTGNETNLMTGEPHAVDVTFQVGDRAAHACVSYFLYGTIVGITAKTVTIQPDGKLNPKVRLTLAKFASLNSLHGLGA